MLTSSPTRNSRRPSTAERLRQAFQILDPKNTGKVSAEHLRLLLRGIGCVWTETKLAAALKSAGVQGTDRGGPGTGRERPRLMCPAVRLAGRTPQTRRPTTSL